ncbi:MAG: hypothetical protein KC736_04960 [Candidatus Moranbacteria bacterium]|nr:hypothetical protein [Candidatus Moranbacteria bacterium]
MYTILLSIKEKTVTLTLKKGEEEIAQSVWQEENNLNEKLLLAIDELLTKHNLAPKTIEKIDLDLDIPESWSTARIAKTVANMWQTQHGENT